MKQGAIVEVTWSDAITRTDWVSLEDAQAQPAAQCVSVGYLTRKDNRVVQIAQTCANTGAIADTLTIPTCRVLKIRRLR